VPSFTFAQSWNAIGNSGTNPSSNFIGTTNNQPLIFKANISIFKKAPNEIV